jgi:hypothetical protein
MAQDISLPKSALAAGTNALLLTLAASWDDFAEMAPLFDIQQARGARSCQLAAH